MRVVGRGAKETPKGGWKVHWYERPIQKIGWSRFKENMFPLKMKKNFPFDLSQGSTKNWGQVWAPR